MSPTFVVTDESGFAQLIDAPSAGEAVVGTPKGVSARLAQQIDIERYAEKEPEKDGN